MNGKPCPFKDGVRVLKTKLPLLFRMSSSGQLLQGEEREPISLAIPEEDIHEVEFKNRKTNVVRLLPNGFQERKLRRLADLSAKIYNELNYEWRQQFFQQQRVEFKGTWNKYYEKYKRKLGVNAQAVMQKNNEAWNSFFSLLNLKKEGKLPPFIKHVLPPHYCKDIEARERRLLLVVRQDRYIVDEENRKLILKDFNMEIEFAGRLRWYGKQGRLEIYYDETRNAWYASIQLK